MVFMSQVLLSLLCCCCIGELNLCQVSGCVGCDVKRSESSEAKCK